MKSLLDLYGHTYQDPRLSSDSQDFTTADDLVQLARNRTYDESLFGQATNWLQGQKKKFAPNAMLDSASLGEQASEAGSRLANLIPNLMLDGAQTANNWMGATAFPEKVETVDMLAPLGLGAMVGPFMPRGAVGSAGGRLVQTADNSIDMSHEARMARAKEMGFDLNNILYHGTAADFDQFKLDFGGATSGSRAGSLGVSSSRSPEIANEFAERASLGTMENSSVLPLLHRSSKRGRLTLDGSEKNFEVAATLADSWDAGFDSVLLKNYSTPSGKNGDVVVVKNPSQLRSVNAAFDPAKSDSANLLAADQARGSLSGLMAQTADDAKGKSVSEDGGTVREQSWWGVPKTVPLDAPYYLPRELVGDWAYRNQGNILHGAIAAASLSPWGAGTRLAIAAPNIGYMLYSKLSGRQEPGWGEQSAPVQGHIPQPLSKPIAGDNHNELMRLLQINGMLP